MLFLTNPFHHVKYKIDSDAVKRCDNTAQLITILNTAIEQLQGQTLTMHP